MSNSANNLPAINVLMVEDTPVQATRFKDLLEKEGLTVYWADSGEKGLEAANSRTFDLVLLDIELPGIDGFEVCKRLKATSAYTNTPVLMLTTRDQAEDVLQGLDLGAVDYIPKDTFAEVVLLETIKHLASEGQFS